MPPHRTGGDSLRNAARAKGGCSRFGIVEFQSRSGADEAISFRPCHRIHAIARRSTSAGGCRQFGLQGEGAVLDPIAPNFTTLPSRRPPSLGTEKATCRRSCCERPRSEPEVSGLMSPSPLDRSLPLLWKKSRSRSVCDRSRETRAPPCAANVATIRLCLAIWYDRAAGPANPAPSQRIVEARCLGLVDLVMSRLSSGSLASPRARRAGQRVATERGKSGRQNAGYPHACRCDWPTTSQPVDRTAGAIVRLTPGDGHAMVLNQRAPAAAIA